MLYAPIYHKGDITEKSEANQNNNKNSYPHGTKVPGWHPAGNSYALWSGWGL